MEVSSHAGNGYHLKMGVKGKWILVTVGTSPQERRKSTGQTTFELFKEEACRREACVAGAENWGEMGILEGTRLAEGCNFIAC